MPRQDNVRCTYDCGAMENRTPLCVSVGLWNDGKEDIETKNVFCTKQG
jgi:hypothetical protein